MSIIQYKEQMGKRAPTIPGYSNSRKCDSLAKYQEIYFPKLQILTELGHGLETSAAATLLFVRKFPRPLAL